MSYLQLVLIFLLCVFVTIIGIQLIVILKKLQKSIDKLNQLLTTSENIARDVEKPAEIVGNVAAAVDIGTKIIGSLLQKDSKNKKG